MRGNHAYTKIPPVCRRGEWGKVLPLALPLRKDELELVVLKLHLEAGAVASQATVTYAPATIHALMNGKSGNAFGRKCRAKWEALYLG